ncbi:MULTISPECIES: glycine amidinotransferase [Streptomyces]|uniref:glycine amidinotransferase n=1 Tax=Streptomyces TaxID=1883 RepID=UPI00163BD604|nr:MULTISPECIES: glycine amidinotransferase [Streptomyces]MBC2879507.1 glycine amidinotransferase [Streptomyces sp. TYQ1024]UBI35015.1 glycine amidinotransferase [Streptomyces mobaraensis]UKW27615.1 glycine amidinotransferase [Streptomyces sp. TYQ1024]
MNHSTPLVNSWNEWDPLREIIVGVADSACFEPSEPGYRPALRDSDEPFPTGPKPAEMVDRANEQLDGLVRVLQAQGVTVRRPDAVDLTRSVKTPTFEVANQYCVVCPRDVMITLGNEIVEATMSRRARYFEYQAYRKLVYSYWNADPRVTWTVAPKPSMADAMYREDFWEWPLEKRHAEMHNSEFCVTQDEVVFDAADMSRFGRDILVQESMTTNRAGIHWLKRHLEPRGFRVHPVHFPLDFFPSHIDCTFVPLRPGLVLTNPERPLREGEERMFHDNGWELIEAPQPTSANDEMPRYCQSSKWLSMNVLSVSPSTVICEEREKPLHDLLDKLGFEVLPVPFRDVFEYGGSLHCATWDVHREGGREDYFPRLDYTPVAPAV